MQRIGFFIYGGIVIDGSAEERDHPLVNVIKAVVTLPVGEASARDGRGEASGLRFCPHGHVSAIAVAANANFVSIDGKLLDHGVDASHEVAIITAPEILDVALGESFALTIAAAGIGAQHKPAQ